MPVFALSRGIGLIIITQQDNYDVNALLSESLFNGQEMDPIVSARIESHQSFSSIIVENCTFINNAQGSIKARYEFNAMILITIPPTNATVSILHCTFRHNKALISVSEESNNLKWSACAFPSKIKLINSSFYHNVFGTLIYFHGADTIQNAAYCLMDVFLSGEVHIYNTMSEFNHLIDIKGIKVHIDGIILVSWNIVSTVLALDSSIIAISGSIQFCFNHCTEVISLKSSSYLKVLEFSAIEFEYNRCSNQLITILTTNTPYPYCLFQYFVADTEFMTHQLQHFYTIKLIDNFQSKPTSLNHFISHCQWLDNAAFHGNDPGVINKNIISIKNPNEKRLVLNGHTNLCFCLQNGMYV